MSSRHLLLLAGTLIVLVVSLGCSSRPLAESWGESFDLTKEAQLLNPDAGQNDEPVTGLDGVAAQSDMKKYQNSFKKEQEVGAQQSRGIFLGPAGGSGM